MAIPDITIDRSKIQTEEEMLSRWGDFDKPLVSISCITYNHEKYICDALDGFLIQKTDFPFEILIHDDASTDQTADIIRKYEKKYPHIVKPIYQKENQYSKGKSPSFFNFQRAQGKYIAICEGDDYWVDPYKIQKQVDFMDKNNEYSICYHNAVKIDSNRNCTNLLSDEMQKNYSSSELLTAPFIPTLTRLYRKNNIEWLKIQNFPQIGDIVCTSYLSRFGGAGYVKGIRPAVYRVHEGGVWSTKSKIDQARMTIDTYLFMASSYMAENNKEASDLFIIKSIKYLLKNL